MRENSVGRNVPFRPCGTAQKTLTGAVQQQAVQRHRLGLQGLQLDLRQPAFRDFGPAVNAGLAFHLLTAAQAAQKFVGIVAGSDFAKRGPGQRFDSITTKKLGPVVMEQITGSKDVAPGHFSSIGDDDPDDVVTLDARSRASKTPLYFIDETVDRNAHPAVLINF